MFDLVIFQMGSDRYLLQSQDFGGRTQNKNLDTSRQEKAKEHQFEPLFDFAVLLL